MLSTALWAASGTAVPQSSGSAGLETIGGLAWSADVRVTESITPESAPHLRAVPARGEYVLWQEPVGNRTWSYLARLDGLGGLLQSRTAITNRTVASWGPGYPTGPNIGADPEGNLHVVWEQNYTDIFYEKLDPQGNELVAPARVGAADTVTTHMPSLSVAGNGSVHIVYEDYRFQCEDILYSQLDMAGQSAGPEHVVTSDVSIHAEFSLAKPDRFSSSTYVTLGTGSYGSWLARLDGYGVREARSVHFSNQSQYKIADVAATPDRNAHLVWEEGTTIYYSRVNATGGMVHDHDVLSTSGRSGAFPHVAAMSDNRTVVVWDDTRTGQSQIMIAILNETSFGSGGPPTAVALTTSEGSATEPWVEVDGSDEIHVAWIDDRDGFPDVYYKRAYTCKIGVTADPSGLRDVASLRPGQSATVALSVSNGGYLSDQFALELSLNASAAARGWSAQLDAASTPPLLSGQKWVANMTVWAPLNATDNDTAPLAFFANSSNIASCTSTHSFGPTVRVTRALHLDAAVNRTRARNGETVSFGFTLTNMGDAREDAVLLLATPDDPRWLLDLVPGQTALDPGTFASGTLTVLVPAERAVVAGDSTFHVRMNAASSADPRFGASLDLWIDVTPELELTVRALDSPVTGRPGEVVRLNFAVEATGNVEPTVRFSASEPHYSAGDPFAPFSLGAPSVQLTFGATFRLYLGFTIPQDAHAGTVYQFTVMAEAQEYGASANAEGQVVVALVCGLSFAAKDTETVSGGSAPIELVLSNAGNGDESVEIEVTGLPAGWASGATAGAAGPTRVTAPAFSVVQTTLTVDASATAVAGPGTVWLRATSGPCGAVEASAVVRVKEQTGFTLSADASDVSARPGEVAVFVIRFTSLANIPQTYLLWVAGLPREMTAWMNVTGPAPQVPPPLLAGGNLSLGPFGTATLRVHIHVPQKTTDEVVPFTFEAYGASRTHKPLELRLLVLHPDLEVVDVVVEGESPQAGAPAVIAVTVGNAGGDAATAVTIGLIVDGQRFATRTSTDLAPGENRTFRFDWTPSAGSHTIEVEVESEGGATEVRLGNNDGGLEVTAVEQPPVVVAAGPPSLAFLGALVAIAAGVAALLMAKRRRREGPPGGP